MKFCAYLQLFITSYKEFFEYFSDFLRRLRDDTGSLAKVRDKMQKKLAKYVAFQQYLDKVLEKAEEVLH
jgi:hypothetical protein